LTAATGRRPDVVLGKPDPGILLDLCHRLGVAPAEMAMVGDRIYTDVIMSLKAGVMAVLVLSGEATAADAAALAPSADLVVADIGELGDKLNSARAGLKRN
jgi:NagD protein